jgi:peptidoglycan/LPS O-acetylase OafA/YrhL
LDSTSKGTRAPGLDGVRALAVLAVMGFHEGASELSGGFLGVDVFFVLSGFLITDLLVRAHQQTGKAGLKAFWIRRARRLLPPLAVMLLVVTAAASLIEPAQEASLRWALLAAGTYTSNWFQIFHHVSYFAAAGPPAPLDHLWSLAIEEQFYLVWPLVIWLLLKRPNGRALCARVAWLGAVASALVMAIMYTPGGDPSAVYYGTDTHASALLIGAALALARPLPVLVSTPARPGRRLDAAGVIGLAVLAWAIGHFSGNDPAVYPVGLIVAALAAAALVAAACGRGVIAAITSWRPLRWIGVRSYGIYLWHWPVIALTAALTHTNSPAPWLWLVESAVTVALAAASWRFIETPIMRDGLRVTVWSWGWDLAAVSTKAGAGVASRLRRVRPVAVAAAVAVVLATAVYGVARPPAPDAPAGLLRQVADGQRVSAESQSSPPAPAGTARPKIAARPTGKARPSATPGPTASAGKPGVSKSPGTSSKSSASPSASRSASGGSASSACPGQPQPEVSGQQVIAVGDSVMLASATALSSAMRGVYIDAKVSRQMETGLEILQDLASSGELRPVIVVGLGTNGVITSAQLRELRRIIGPDRDLILVNTFGPQSWENQVNDTLAAATRKGDHTELANWDDAIAGHTSLLWPDGIHPQPSGAKLYARVVVAAIKAQLTRDQAASCPHPNLRPGQG